LHRRVHPRDWVGRWSVRGLVKVKGQLDKGN